MGDAPLKPARRVVVSSAPRPSDVARVPSRRERRARRSERRREHLRRGRLRGRAPRRGRGIACDGCSDCGRTGSRGARRGAVRRGIDRSLQASALRAGLRWPVVPTCASNVRSERRAADLHTLLAEESRDRAPRVPPLVQGDELGHKALDHALLAHLRHFAVRCLEESLLQPGHDRETEFRTGCGHRVHPLSPVSGSTGRRSTGSTFARAHLPPIAARLSWRTIAWSHRVNARVSTSDSVHTAHIGGRQPGSNEIVIPHVRHRSHSFAALVDEHAISSTFGVRTRSESGGQDKEVDPRGAYLAKTIHQKWDPRTPLLDPRCR